MTSGSGPAVRNGLGLAQCPGMTSIVRGDLVALRPWYIGGSIPTFTKISEGAMPLLWGSALMSVRCADLGAGGWKVGVLYNELE